MENASLDIISEIKQNMEIGQVFVESGMFPDIKTSAQAVVKIMAGKEIGLSPFESMHDFYIVSGRLTLTANALAKLIKKSGKYDYTVEKLDEQECVLCFYTINGERKELGKSIFTFKDAAKAELVNKTNWKNYPRNMLFARALSNGQKWHCPDASRGYYTTEEMQDIIDVPMTKTVSITDQGVTSGETEKTV